MLQSEPATVERLQPAYEELVQTLSKVGQSMYEAAAAQESAAGGAAGDDTTVEGEFREVGSDR